MNQIVDLFFSYINQIQTTKKIYICSGHFNTHQTTSWTSIKKIPTSTHLNQLQSTSTYFNQLQSTSTKKIPTSIYFNSLLPISTNFTYLPAYISQRKEQALNRCTFSHLYATLTTNTPSFLPPHLCSNMNSTHFYFVQELCVVDACESGLLAWAWHPFSWPVKVC